MNTQTIPAALAGASLLVCSVLMPLVWLARQRSRRGV